MDVCSLKKIPVGTVVFSGNAYDFECPRGSGTFASDAVPVWVADAVTASVVTPVSLSFKREGEAVITASFDEETECASGDQMCSGLCVPNDAMACGDSCVTCPTDPLGTATCKGGTCSMECDAGYNYCYGDSGPSCKSAGYELETNYSLSWLSHDGFAAGSSGRVRV